MKNEIMICGIDCQPGDGHCNNYCNHDHSKPMADHPPKATNEQVMRRAVKRAQTACDKADEAINDLRVLHNELFADGVLTGLQSLSDSCKRRREKLVLLTPNNLTIGD